VKVAIAAVGTVTATVVILALPAASTARAVSVWLPGVALVAFQVAA